MRTSRLLLAALAAMLLGCQTVGRQAPVEQLPSNNPTETSTGLATSG